MYCDPKILLQHRQHCYYDFVQQSEPASTCSLQEILALTGGGKTREYTETRPDGSTVTYTIDVEEEEYEVFARETIFPPDYGDIQSDFQEEVEMEITTTRTVKTMEFVMEGQGGGGRSMEIIREGGGSGGQVVMSKTSGGRSMERGGGAGEVTITRSSTTISGGGSGGTTITNGGSGAVEVSMVSWNTAPCSSR